MKRLSQINPSPEQLTIIKRVRSGVELIRGAAGSGKTTTAILKLKLFVMWVATRRRRLNNESPVRALVLTFNKTLRGYVEQLVKDNSSNVKCVVDIETFGHWSFESLGRPTITEPDDLKDFCELAAGDIGLPADFLAGEATYAIGRFLPENLTDYLTCRRDGRGSNPRVERPIRQSIIDSIITPYQKWKKKYDLCDWDDLAVRLAKEKLFQYDVIIVDECQDFSANQLRAVLNQLAPDGAATFIIDTAQRIYAGGFTWTEIGLNIRPENSHRLSVNYRNTAETAKLAASLMTGVPLDDDGTPPVQPSLFGNPRPILLRGLFKQQVFWCIDFINNHVDLEEESVAFLHPKGWFKYLINALNDAGLEHVHLTRKSEWPDTSINLALSTLHSAKGLDFDYVFIIGLDKTGLPEGDFDLGDDRFENACRLLAMAIARARKQAILGYKDGEQPNILMRLDNSAYDEIIL